MKRKIILVLDNIRSRENVGSIFRTADAAGVSKIYLCGITPTPSIGNSKLQTRNSKQTQNSKFSRFVPNRGSSIAMQSGQIQNQDKISKTALGAEKWVPWEYHKQTWKCLLEIRNQNAKTPHQSDPLTAIRKGSGIGAGQVKILGLEQTKNSKNIFKYKFPKNNRPTKSGESRPNGAEKIVLVVGNEVRGLSPKILEYCDKIIAIPMYGRKESLNVAVAVGVTVYAVMNAQSP